MTLRALGRSVLTYRQVFSFIDPCERPFRQVGSGTGFSF
jgi:hypothetical protein